MFVVQKIKLYWISRSDKSQKSLAMTIIARRLQKADHQQREDKARKSSIISTFAAKTTVRRGFRQHS